MENKYKGLIENKKVIFVGPAPLLKGKDRGSWIDSEFDVVIRTNGSSFLLDNEEYRKDYGSRMDVLYCNVQFHREMGPLPLEKWQRMYGLKFVNFKILNAHYERLYSRVLPVRKITNLIRILQKDVPSILMGPIILKDILQFNPRSVYFTGMDFFINKPDVFIPGDYREYFPGYLPDKITKKADIDNIGRIDPHDQYANCKLVYQLYKGGFIQTDLEIVNIMKTIIQHPADYSVNGKKQRVKKQNIEKQLKRSTI